MRQYNVLTNIGKTLTWELDDHGIAHFTDGSRYRYIGTEETIMADYVSFSKFFEANFAPIQKAEEQIDTLGAALIKLQSTNHPGLFEIKENRIRWSYIASYVDATRVEDLHSTQNEAMMHVINTIGAGAFRLHSAGNSNDRCWFEIEVV